MNRSNIMKIFMKNITTTKLNISSTLKMAVAMLVLSSGVASAQFSVLHSFTGGADGANPYYGAPAITGSTIYGTANLGAGGGGVVFSVNTDGSGFAVLHTFTNVAPDGYQPLGTVALSGSTLYGTTYYGGSGNGTAGYGTVFAVNTDGSGYQTLHSFTTSTGYKPYGAVIVDGSTLYGMTYYGAGTGVGSIYSLPTDGSSFTNLHTFVGGMNDGSRPLGGSLLLNNGALYGTTVHGGTGSAIGTANDGVVFSVNPDGSGYTNLVNFTGGTTNGANPYGSLTLVGSKLYGMTRIGGSANLGTIFSVNTDGTGYTNLFNFTGGTTNGANPNGSLTLDGPVLFGTTKTGGTSNLGTVFMVNLDGSGFNILHSFTNADGANPDGDLTLANNALYGWTSAGGVSNKGTVFAQGIGASGYAFLGQGFTNGISGNVANGGLYSSSTRSWPNGAVGTTYTNTSFALPVCDSVVQSRLVISVWGGTADYTCQMTVNINGTNLPAASPFVFGSTTFMNDAYNIYAPHAYGSGYGTWLVTLPIPGGMLRTDGGTNVIVINETTPDYFDGRIYQVTLAAVYQSSALTNVFDYAWAEGSADMGSYYGNPLQRTATLDSVSTNGVTDASIMAVFGFADTTTGDTDPGTNDRLYFNGAQLGGDNVAHVDGDYSTTAAYGFGSVTFDGLTNLLATNTVTFSVGSDVPSPQETKLRYQFVALGVTRAAPSAGQLQITGIDATGAHLVWSGATYGNYWIESTTNLSHVAWSAVTNFTSTSGTMTFTDSTATNGASRFYRAKTQ